MYDVFLWCIVEDRLALISILTSNSTSTQPADPSRVSNAWVTANYRELTYAAVGIIDFRPATIARHVAVYSENLEPLSLAEVEVYGKIKYSLRSATLKHKDCMIWLYINYYCSKHSLFIIINTNL